MDFDFTEDQQALRALVHRWAEKAFPFDRRQQLVRDGGFTRELYGQLGGLGLTGLVVPEAHGGMGLGAVEALVVMEELGRALVPAPYAQAALIAPSLLATGPAELQAAWLPRVADATALVVLAHQERGARYRLDQVATRATADGEHWRLDGAKSIVPAADEADAFIVPAHSAHGIKLFLVERAAAGLRAYQTQDGARAGELRLDATPATLITHDGLLALERGADIGIAAACAEAVGAMDRLVGMTADYLNTRRQFGVPIASFQALRHRMADVKMQLELARSMSYFATLKLNEPPAARRRALSQAKLQLGHSLRAVDQACIQLHGGIGVTDEYAAGHYFKRLTMLELSWGDSMHHLGEVARRIPEQVGVAP